MFTRISKPILGLALLSLALSGCGRAPSSADVAAKQQAEIAGDRRIPCAHGSAALAPTCTVEQALGKDGLILTVRHADGAFRRLLVTQDGRGVIAADGAEVATVTVVGRDGIDVALGNDRYRLPATVRGVTSPS
ncbi:hypothetical protein EV283_1557 [Sphingomonas sp. BK036]|uniref:hypothetical protein n=1 Tax=Sphingomonas sp. BK036 TaxID=2512122 RepID=UPI0010293188|nr:hypothetical protein [Sphingomonas sp. BK036]RZT54775.1 hypothetical protein EV283_1557 [Sphingomonas sp. BK036]